MNKQSQGKKPVNIESLHLFLNEYITPGALAKLIDEFLYNYMTMLVQLLEEDKIVIHNDTLEFSTYMKLLRDVLTECGKCE